MILKLKRTPGLYLVGFMACGKTTAGRLLAPRLGWRFIDLDDDIEAAAGTTIPEIFEQEGEPAFRDRESSALRRRVTEIEHGQPTVLALGGGAFAVPRNYETLENNGVTIWLDCPLAVLRERVKQEENRPLAKDPEKFARLYEDRLIAYSRADYRVDAEAAPDTIVESILSLPLF